MSDETEGVFAGSVPEGYREHLEPVIFRPWAQRLLDFVGVSPGHVVLDVAAGTGVVARLAATLVGSSGSVIASDISPGMLAHVQTGADPDGAPIKTLECSATDLTLDAETVDVVLCQQGFPFIPDRIAASREMKRVLRPGGVAGAAVWQTGARVDPFDTYAEVLAAHGAPEPFPGAYSMANYEMTTEEVEGAFTGGGLVDVRVSVQELTLAWASPEAAAVAISGTPFGPVVHALADAARASVMADLVRAFSAPDGGVVDHTMTAVFGRGSA